MKLRNVLVMATASLMLAACDEETPIVNLGQDVSGTYNGYTLGSCNYFTNQLTENETITITAASETTADISYVSGTWGTFSIAGATIAASGNTYVISGSGTSEMGHGGNVSSYDCTMSATINSDKSVVSWTFSIPAVMGGMTIDFFEGEAPAQYAVAGSYQGTLDVSVSGASQGNSEGNVSIEATDENMVTITLGSFSINAMGSQMTFGDVVIEKVNVSGNAGDYTLSGTFENLAVSMGASSINVTGSVEGTVTNGIPALTFQLTPGAMPMPITVVFTATEE